MQFMDYKYFFEQVTGAYGVGRVIGRWERRPEDCLLMWRPVECGMCRWASEHLSTVLNARLQYPA